MKTNYIEFKEFFGNMVIRIRPSSINTLAIRHDRQRSKWDLDIVTGSGTEYRTEPFNTLEAAQAEYERISALAFSDEEYCKVIAKKGAFYGR